MHTATPAGALAGAVPARGFGARLVAVSAAAILAVASGCKSSGSQDAPPGADTGGSFLDSSEKSGDAVNAIFDQQAENAVVTQRVLNEYHFVPYQANLTPLGKEHLEMLASSMWGQPANEPLLINVPRGTATERLYEARLATVRSHLAESGVSAGSIQIVDRLAAGKGITSDRVITAEREQQAGLETGAQGASYRPQSTGSNATR